jgi:hypothetical protein
MDYQIYLKSLSDEQLVQEYRETLELFEDSEFGSMSYDGLSLDLMCLNCEFKERGLNRFELVGEV